jgi:hypothetical protein
MASSSSARGSGLSCTLPKASLSSVPRYFSQPFTFVNLNSVVHFYLKPKFIHPSRKLDPISLILFTISLGSPFLDQWVILTPLRWSVLKLAELPSSMLLWIWSIGTVVLGLGHVTSKGGEIGISEFLWTRGFGSSIKLVNASLYLYLRCPRTNLFWKLPLIFGLMHLMFFVRPWADGSNLGRCPRVDSTGYLFSRHPL